MAAERYYFRWLNVSLWQTSHFPCILIGFHTSLIDMHTEKPFIPDPLQLQMSLFSERESVLCVRTCVCAAVCVYVCVHLRM